jgi:mannosyltransferase
VVNSTSDLEVLAPADRRRSKSLETSRWDALVIGVLACLVSGFRYWRPSLWTDETATISAGTRPLGDLWRLIHNVDVVHALYYFGMHFWIELFGQSTWSVRFPSLIAIGFAAAATVRLGQQLASREVALFAGLIFMILPRVTWAGTEARTSALAAAFVAWSFVTFVSALRSGGRTRWIVYGVLLLLGSATFLYGALVVLGQLLLAACTVRRHDVRRLIVPIATMGVVGVAMLPLAAAAHNQSGQLVGGKPTLPALVRTIPVQQWFLGELPTRSQTLVLFKGVVFDWAWAAVIAAVLTWVAVVVAIALQFRRAGSDRHQQLIKEFRSIALVAVPWLVVPTVAIVLYSIAVYPIYNTRYFTFSAPALALFLAGSLRLLFRSPVAVVASVVVLALLTIPIYTSQRAPYAKKASDWAAAAARIQEFGQPGEPIIYTRLFGKRGVTTGKLAIAYPDRVRGLVDVTLNKTPSEVDKIWERQKPLSAVVGELDNASSVVVVTDRQLPYTGKKSVERPILNSLGYHVVGSWKGPSTIVYQLDR